MYYIRRILFGVTPRSIYTLSSIKWGTTFPSITLIAVIAIAYMVISPIINGLAVVSFFLFYQMYKYLFVYALEQPKESETGGLFFPRAISHIFVGMYIQQICLATLFFLARDSEYHPSAVPQGVLMIVLLGLTVSLVVFVWNVMLTEISIDSLQRRLFLVLRTTPQGSSSYSGSQILSP